MAQSSRPTSPLSHSGSSFPNPLPGDASQRAPSIISSQMTDAGSEADDGFFQDGLNKSTRPATAVSNDANRPGSALSSHTRPSTRAPPSRRGFGSPRSQPAFRGGANMSLSGSVSGSSRPGSATSKTSRSHVPSLASHAFFKPMSSQRLQAQRSGRPDATPTYLHQDPVEEAEGTPRRHSLATNVTENPEDPEYSLMERPQRSHELAGPRPEDHNPMNASPEGKYTYRSFGESERPLQSSGNRQNEGFRPKYIQNMSANFMKGKGSRRSSPNEKSLGQERLPSSPTSPTFNHASGSKPRPGLNHEHFSGNTVFFFGGRFQNTRDRPVNIATGLIVLVPSILFFVYSAPYLSHHITPAIPAVYAYLFFITMSSFVHASVTDPGILPRNLHPLPPPESDDPLCIPPPLTHWTMVKAAGFSNSAMDVPTKYCKTCSIWRPPRCHHCRNCDNCVETQDHHCVWVNNCIGRRNYRYFFGFVCSSSLLALFLMLGSLGQCLHFASTNHIAFADSIKINRVPFAMVLYGILGVPYVACLTVYHLWLIARGETTREYLNSHKFLKKDRHKPFTQGNAIHNWHSVLLRPRPPTYLRFKDAYEHGDQRLGSGRGQRSTHGVTEQPETGMELTNVAQQ